MMPTQPLDQALDLLGDPGARGELEAAVERFRQAERTRADGPAHAARLKAISSAARLLADAASDAILPASAVAVDDAALRAIARAARQAHDRIEAALAGPSARWSLLMALATTWTARGHRLGSGDGGKFHRFAQLVGDTAGCEITHHAIRQLCAKWSEKEGGPHTARGAVTA